MTFDELLAQVIDLLQHQGRVSYRALKLRFTLDDDYLDGLKDELIHAQRLAVDEDGRVLVWTGQAQPTPAAALPTLQAVPTPGMPDVSAPAVSPSTSPSTATAERRQLTVMFCDLVDSTRLAGQLDPEDLRDVVRAYQAVCAAAIGRFGGHIAQYLGDGLLIYFGYPLAHEDDALRAVHTALAILEAMQQLNSRLERERRVRLAVRLGIHTGLVVVGDMGGGDRQEQLALGETPNIAARLQSLAAPDTVVISAATQQLVQGLFTCDTMGVQALKGMSQPIEVYRVLGVSAAQSRFEAAVTTGLTPLVGREEEVGLLRRRWEQVVEGHGQVVVLSGEAGIGKSRLVQELRQWSAHTGGRRLTFRCSPYTQQSALYPVIDHLQRALEWQRDDTPAAKLAKLEQGLRGSRVSQPEAVPLLATLLSLPHPASYPPLSLSPQRQKQRTWNMLVAWLLEEAEQQPVLAIWEDLHWADPSTLEWLGGLLEQVPTVRLLTLLTHRPEFRPPWPQRSHVTPLALTRLTRPQIEAMVTCVAGGKPLPAAVVQQIVARTDGVPLFVEELVKAVLETGLVQEETERYVLTGPLPTLAIPATLHDALMARLDRLGAAKGVAQLGAVLGREFAYELLQAVAAMEEATLQHSLGQLVEVELLYQRGQPPQATYLFKHALVQDTAYQSLLRSTRQLYHQRVTQVLESRFPEIVESQPELLAHHALRGEVWDKAVAYGREAGTKAVARSAYHEAVTAFEQALTALTHLPETRETREQAIDLRLALRSALLPSGDLGRILACVREAEVLAVALDDPRRLAQISVFLSNYFHRMGAYDQAIAAAQRTLALAAASGEVDLQALANLRLGAAFQGQGDYRRAIDCLQQTVASLNRARRHERFGQTILPAVASRALLATCHAELGTFAEGRALGDEGLRIAEAMAHPESLMLASWGIGLLALRHGDLPSALSLLERAVGFCQDADFPLWFPMIAAPLGEVYMLAGRVADAVSLLSRALKQTIVLKRVDLQALCHLALGEAQAHAGCLEEAHTLAEQALAQVREYQERGNQAYTLRLFGEIAARRQPPEVAHAAAHYQQARTLAEELGMGPLVAHCHRGLGTLYATAGQTEQAGVELSTAIEMYRAMDMTFWLPQAEATLAQEKGR
jgi:class 3 adenylate cyclase/tetratricopeptide (TPR) repeat protein